LFEVPFPVRKSLTGALYELASKNLRESRFDRGNSMMKRDYLFFLFVRSSIGI